MWLWLFQTQQNKCLKGLKKCFFDFLWNKKSEKVRRADAKKPERLGGLGMPDIEQFWFSFKFSWLRRLLTTNSYWPNILLDRINAAYGKKYSNAQILELGPILLEKIGKSLKNNFWKQVLSSTSKILEGYIFDNPEMMLYTPFWYNPNIRRGNKAIKYSDFHELQDKIEIIGDFFKPGTNTFMNFDDFRRRYETEISDNKLIDIRYTLRVALQRIDFCPSKLINVYQP